MNLFTAPPAKPSIFSTISQLARQHEAVNLGQGFPDFSPSEELLDRLGYHIKHSSNQYAPMAGMPPLLEAIARKTERCHGLEIDAARELTVTSGATQALWTSIQALVSPGDEVILFEPAYDSYAPAVRAAGGTVIPLVLEAPSFRPDWSRFAERLSERTRLVIINNPHNPLGTCWREEDLLELQGLLKDTNVALLSDEVYEHLTYDGREHLSVLRYPQLRERAFVVSSFGKTFHVTGWKVGYVIAPHPLMVRFRNLHQFTVFCVNTPAQLAIADYLADASTYESLPAFFQAKRDYLFGALADTELEVVGSEGSYFGLVKYGKLFSGSDEEFAQWLIEKHGVACIPLSPFYSEAPQGQTLVRLCFAKREETLAKAAVRLAELGEPSKATY